MHTKISDETKVALDYILSKNLRLNTFTGRVENADGSVFEDIHLNSIFIELKERGQSVSKDLVRSIVGSDKIPAYDPLKEWLGSTPQGEGELDRLLKSLDFKGPKEELRKLVIKWLLQFVAAIVQRR